MSFSPVSIANLSLAIVGADSIRDINEKNKRARLILAMYEPNKTFLLHKFDWSFARKKAELKLLTDQTQPDATLLTVRLYAYALPADCLTPRDVYPLGSRQPWEVEGTTIWATPAENAWLRYTRNDVEEPHFSPTFVNLLSTVIAAKIAPSLTQDMKLSRLLADQVGLALREDPEADMNIGNMYREHDEDPNNDTFVNPDAAIILPASLDANT